MIQYMRDTKHVMGKSITYVCMLQDRRSHKKQRGASRFVHPDAFAPPFLFPSVPLSLHTYRAVAWSICQSLYHGKAT